MKEIWTEIRKGGDFRAMAESFGIDPLIARIIRNRDIVTEEEYERYLNGTLDDMENPLLLDGMRDAARLIRRKIEAHRKIRIIGDYDIDGVFSVYILICGMRKLGADVDYRIPHRIEDGYGMNVRMIEEAAADGVETIVTCDNGISAIEPVRRARELGLTVVITDHHEPFYETDEKGVRHFRLPDADVIVDPKKPDCAYPNKQLCGAGVAWKLIHTLECLDEDADAAGETGSRAMAGIRPVDTCPLTYSLVPFAAFATIGDVMDLTGENRILVKHGLKMLPDTGNTGMNALIEATGLKGKEISAYHVGFVLGPCVNAAGRIESATESEELLLCEDPERAQVLALGLTQLNDERKSLTQQGLDTAVEMIESGPLIEDRVLVVYLPGTHESVVGIIAGKLRERYYKPSIVFTEGKSADGVEILKGSGRSTEEYSMFDELVKCADLMVKFGGHPMAAGMSIRKADLEALRMQLNENCTLSETDMCRKIRIDSRLPLGYISENLIGALSVLEPCGKGNPKPVFALPNLTLHSARILGKAKNAVKLRVSDEQNTYMDALWFGDSEQFHQDIATHYSESAWRKLLASQESGIRLTCTFEPEVNEFRGTRTLQIYLRSYLFPG